MDERREVLNIPINYGGSANIMGFAFDSRKFIEGVILGAAAGLITFTLIGSIRSITGIQKIIWILGVAAVGFFLGVRGANGDPLSVFVMKFIAFQRKKRICYYNPRIKIEARPFMYQSENEEQFVSGKDKIIKFINEKKNSDRETVQADTSGYMKLKPGEMFFEEDIGIVQAPDNYIVKDTSDDNKKEKKGKADARKEEKKQRKKQGKGKKAKKRTGRNK